MAYLKLFFTYVLKMVRYWLLSDLNRRKLLFCRRSQWSLLVMMSKKTKPFTCERWQAVDMKYNKRRNEIAKQSRKSLLLTEANSTEHQQFTIISLLSISSRAWILFWLSLRVFSIFVRISFSEKHNITNKLHINKK